ncbi:NAD(P)+ transhydrogenase beta chain [Allorhizobium pseudoryzae]|uniref:NAD(P)+ transhydrogenase beta chain n=1 Tax=Allorhizobium pseudoryzae TaxID=379684 RepID=UPI003D064B9E
MQKPYYSTSKQMLWISLAMAWTVMLTLTIGAALNGEAVAFGTIAVPSMVGLIVAMLGIHRGFGSLDFRAARDVAPEAPSHPPYHARYKPIASQGETP